ncbi:MFS transporter protein [Rutstroemia sp. NJR-2017a WRK4]|nr:MFS transporter protein [Rutstroemia sp. NJR-2017a WRK4]
MDQNLDERAVRDLELELHTEIYPGTEVMRDVGTHHFVKGGDSVLVPQPSDDEYVCLEFSDSSSCANMQLLDTIHCPMWKFFAMTCVTMSTFAQGMGPLALAPMFPDYIKEWDSDIASVVQFTGVAILVLGFSNFIWVPIQNCYGRRPVLIFSLAICFGSSIWRAEAKSYGSFMGACVLNGIGAGPAETAQPTVIADIMFLHERGRYNTLYFTAYMGSLMIGPIISGSMAQALGWRSFWWLNTGVLGFVTLACIFLFPETRYRRAFPHAESPLSSSPGKASAEHIEEKSIKPSDGLGADSDVIEKELTSTTARTNRSTPAVLPSSENPQDPWLRRGRPSRKQWALYQPLESSLLAEFILPWKLFFFPIVQFASFVVSWSCSSFLTLNLTQSQVFGYPPYTYSSQTIGFFNFAILVGAILGLVTAGPLSDFIAAKLTQRNKGVREPEMRLLAMVPYVLIMIVGNVVVALGYQYKWDWKVIVIIGFTCAGIQVAALPAIASTYAVDSYKPVSGAMFVTITVNKNVWGYGFSKFITPWTESAGYIPPIMTNMALVTLWCSFGIVFWFYGKRFRGWTKNSKVHAM